LPVAFAARCFLGSRKSIVLIIHGIEAWQPHSSALVNHLARRIDTFIAVSNFTRQRFSEWTGLSSTNGFLLPNSIECSGFRGGPKDPSLLRRYQLEGRKVILTMARMNAAERYKGMDEVMEILPTLVRNMPEIVYVIVGDGNDRGRLERKASGLGLRDRIIFTGWIPEEEKAAHLRLADAFVMPGWGEGFGIVYLEALACGIPVVGSKLDASCEVLRNGEWGIVVNPRNREELVAGILDALQKPRGIVPSGLEYYSFPQFQRRCHEMLDQILENASLVADSSEENALKTWN
jgi:glycosyltransferase involved in cell wall biosynthesis